MTYEEAVGYIDSVCGTSIKLGLTRIEALLDKLGNPQDKMKIIHVAGTNGKGSTCAMLSSILTEAGYRVGVYTSPHLVKYNERYCIGGEDISDTDFAFYMNCIREKCMEMVEEGQGQPTVFEILTALAFCYFYNEKIDYLCLEVGLGGRFDATNVVKEPLLCVITSIGMDHMDYLGNDLASIAFEKGGIIKTGRPVVLYTQKEEVHHVIEELCKEKKAPLYYAWENRITISGRELDKTNFSIQNEYIAYNSVDLRLIGPYQINNCATVLLACKALQDEGVMLAEDSILKGIQKASWGGRMEIVSRDPFILIDGAHNIDGIEMLSRAFVQYFAGKDITLLMGVLGDKEYTKMAELLLPLVSRVVITEPNNTRALSVDSFAEVICKFQKPVTKEKNIEKALEIAVGQTAADGILCCAGSLYLIGEIRNIVLNRSFGGLKHD